ncbi:N-formylglutamate amidohydrolase [Granulicatella elegans]|uniref:N-formylglutamate amidohydrolase n=1 Tax=Granulicatella elegans TaxID=137732 RepID=UPI001D1362D0|nr:N-formylglutamate amidohydrolase [Granulicatella elegans]UEA31273.1 N-formylglutamate amidohydrolase [Granulicatella elegans]
MNSYITVKQVNHASPILLSIPHSGLKIPEEIQVRINPKAKRIHTDWEMDTFIKDFPFTSISSKLTRYIVDVNRSKYTSKTSTRSIIPKYDEVGNPLFKQYPSKAIQQQWLKEFYTPYYDAILEQISLKEQNFTKICLLDLHSYDDKYFKTEKIIISTRNEATISKKSLEFIVSCFEKEKLSIQVDTPFKGGNIIHELSKQPNVEAIQIEIPYSIYLFENKLDKNKVEIIQEKLLNVFLKIEEFYTNF